MGCGQSTPAAAGRAAVPPGTPLFGAPAGVPAMRGPARGGGGGGAGAASSSSASACLLDGPGPHTPSSLRARREAFWESRTSGSAAVWGSLRLACEASLQGDVALAATVLEAVGLREAVRGNLSCVYEASGRAYEVPVWCWREPANLTSEEAAAAAAAASRRARRGAAGPAVAVTAVLRLSACASSAEQDITLPLRSDMSAAAVCAALHAHLQSGAADQARDETTPRPNVWSAMGGLPLPRQRLVFRGRVLANDCTLHEAGVASGDIIQVRERRAAHDAGRPGTDEARECERVLPPTAARFPAPRALPQVFIRS